MLSICGIGRIALLAVGLGVGVAVAHPPVAEADSSNDWSSAIDSLLAGGALSAPAQTMSALDMQISIDGYDLLPTADNSATATSGMGDIAIAVGNGSFAAADGGTGDFAFAEGANGFAAAGGAGAVPGVVGNGNDDVAIDIGNNTGTLDGAFAGGFPGFTAAGDHDIAVDIGNNTGNNDGPFAGDGNFDRAIDVGNNTGNFQGGYADTGNFDTSETFGDNGNAIASTGDHDFASVFDPTATATSPGSVALATYGNDNFASVVGDGDHARAGGVLSTLNAVVPGNNDVASIFGNGDTTAAGADASAPGNFDLAAVVGDDIVSKTATGGSDLVAIQPPDVPLENLLTTIETWLSSL